MNRLDNLRPARNAVRLAILGLLAVTLLAASFGTSARALEPLVLREQIEVLDDIVTLGHLFENAGEESNVAVFRAPELGTTGIVSASRVSAAAGQHGLEWSNPGGIQEVTVSRPGRLVTLEEIRNAIAEHAARGDGKWSVDFSRGTRPFHIDSRITAPIRVKQFDSGLDGGPFRATLTVEHDRIAVRDETVTGHAYPSVEAIVPARTIQRGTTITRDDLEVVDLPRARVSNTAIEDMKAAIGMAARQRLAPGRPIRRDHLEHPKLVTRNSLVTITYAAPGMVLKAKGRALDDAAKGDPVQVVNLQSKRTIEARVTGSGLVSVTGLQTMAAPKRTATSREPAGEAINSYVR